MKLRIGIPNPIPEDEMFWGWEPYVWFEMSGGISGSDPDLVAEMEESVLRAVRSAAPGAVIQLEVPSHWVAASSPEEPTP